jgi:hypothetical protein
LLACLLVASSASLSAESVTLTVKSDPAGALLYENGKQWGYAPFALKYTVPKDFKKSGRCVTFKPAFVRWASGAASEPVPVTLCGTNGTKQELVFVRPTGVEGREIDALFALQLQQQALASQQARDQAFANAFRPPRAVVCSSQVIGTSVTTTCF